MVGVVPETVGVTPPAQRMDCQIAILASSEVMTQVLIGSFALRRSEVVTLASSEVMI